MAIVLLFDIVMKIGCIFLSGFLYLRVFTRILGGFSGGFGCSGGFGWVRVGSGGFGWVRVGSGGFGWFKSPCFTPYGFIQNSLFRKSKTTLPRLFTD